MARIWNKHKQIHPVRNGRFSNGAGTPLKRKVFVAMSGGVDSSVTAALLKKKGYNITGVFMKPWNPSLESGIWNLESGKQNSKFKIQNSSFCLWQKDREDAMRVAAIIGIPLLTWDFSTEYKKEVADYMIREYRAGRTPNPDVTCNKHIKFGLFLEKALKEGADFIATGHYVRLRQCDTNIQMHTNDTNKKNRKLVSSKQIRYSLIMARDKNKDQSYFLWTLTHAQLKHCLFPIGDYTKPEVRKLAKNFGLPTADKKDSQGVCFIGPLDMKEFLTTQIKPKHGEIRLLGLDLKGISRSNLKNSSVIGIHDGAFYYTIGQRHGLDIKNGKGPYFVVKKDLKKNILYVGFKKDLFSQKLKLTDINWINPTDQPVDKRHRKSFIHRDRGLDADVRVRYRAPLSKAIVTNNGEVIFEKPETAITSGQSAVFYRGEELLGGGIIR